MAMNKWIEAAKLAMAFVAIVYTLCLLVSLTNGLFLVVVFTVVFAAVIEAQYDKDKGELG